MAARIDLTSLTPSTHTSQDPTPRTDTQDTHDTQAAGANNTQGGAAPAAQESVTGMGGHSYSNGGDNSESESDEEGDVTNTGGSTITGRRKVGLSLRATGRCLCMFVCAMCVRLHLSVLSS